ncbi:MAG: patatin family protein [Paludibacteraceae bacterium]|nr:patatin family protein [Paludibacteraceae bacterium]
MGEECNKEHHLMEGIGLVLEGGGMRCVFTAGVLDYFLDHGIEFPYTAAVSGGACTAMCYLAKQRGRQKKCFIDLYEKYHYISLKNWVTKGSMFDFDLVFDEFSNRILPFDYDTYFSNPCQLETVASNCLTGEAEYLDERKDRDRLTQICRASSSLPIIMKQQKVDGVPMLDGGISDPVPIKRAISKGFSKNVVVLTRNRGHVSPFTNLPIPPKIFGAEIRKKMRNRGARYNEILRFVEQEADKGNILLIQPKKKLKVSAVEKNIDRLRELYQEGYECGAEIWKWVK